MPSAPPPSAAMIVPTTRAVMLLALAAPLAVLVGALVPGAWLAAPVLGLCVLVAIAVDARLAGRLGALNVTVPEDVEVGLAAAISIKATITGRRVSQMEAAIGCDPRLAEGGRMTFALALTDGEWRGQGRFAALRRGTGNVEGLWLRWTGPLGLAGRQSRGTIARAVRIWPNVAAIRSPAFQTYLRDAQYGMIARRIRGEGAQFEALAEYEPGMDRRRIDWKASARHVHLYAKEYETERNNQIVFAFDCGQAMCEPVHGMPRLDRAISAALATSYVALRGGDRVALFGFASRPEVSSPFVTSSTQFHRLQRAAAGLEYRSEEPNFTLALATLAGRLQRRSLVVVFSDFSDPTGAELMIESVGRLVNHHVVLFVALVDEELETMAGAEPDNLDALAMAVSADMLLRQRLAVTRRLRQIGVDVIEAPWDRVGTRLIDAYLAIKRSGVIG